MIGSNPAASFENVASAPTASHVLSRLSSSTSSSASQASKRKRSVKVKRSLSPEDHALLQKIDEAIWVHKKAEQMLKDAEEKKRDANLQLRALQERVQQGVWEKE